MRPPTATTIELTIGTYCLACVEHVVSEASGSPTVMINEHVIAIADLNKPHLKRIK